MENAEGKFTNGKNLVKITLPEGGKVILRLMNKGETWK